MATSKKLPILTAAWAKLGESVNTTLPAIAARASAAKVSTDPPSGGGGGMRVR